MADGLVLDSFDRLVNGRNGDKEPFARRDSQPEAIDDLAIDPRVGEEFVDDVLELGSIDIIEFIGCRDLHRSHQESRVTSGIGDAFFDRAISYADLVEDAAILPNLRMIGRACGDIDRSTGLIALFGSIGEERASLGFGDMSACIILIERALEGSEEEIAFGSIIIDDAESTVVEAVFVDGDIADIGDIGNLTVKDEELSLLDFGFEETCFFSNLSCAAGSIVKAMANFDEEGFKEVEILTGISTSDLLCGANFGARFDMTEDTEVIFGRIAAEFVEQLLIAELIAGIVVLCGWIEEVLRVEFVEQIATFLLLANVFEADGIEAFKDIVIVALGQSVMMLDEVLDFLKAGDDAFLLMG